MNRRKLLLRILQGSHQNISFSDFVNLLGGLGFRALRIRGSHHIFYHPLFPDLVNLQPSHGQTKAYEIREVLHLIRQYNLRLEEES